MFNPFIDLISNVIFLINLALLVWVVIGLLIHFDIVNRYSPVVNRVYSTLGRLIEPMLRRIRRVTAKFIPDLGGIDLSPIILLLLLHFINNAMYSWFYRI
jgi:YggT family protein